jgi:hypothetical protein
LRKYRFGDDDSLGVAYLSNAYMHSSHSDNNVIPKRLTRQAAGRTAAGKSHASLKKACLRKVLKQSQVLEFAGKTSLIAADGQNTRVQNAFTTVSVSPLSD